MQCCVGDVGGGERVGGNGLIATVMRMGEGAVDELMGVLC